MSAKFQMIQGKSAADLAAQLNAFLVSAGAMSLVGVEVFKRESPAAFLWEAVVTYYAPGVTLYRAALAQASVLASLDTVANALMQAQGDGARLCFLRDTTPDEASILPRESAILVWKTTPLPENIPQRTRAIPVRALADIASGATGTAYMETATGPDVASGLITLKNMGNFTWKAGKMAMAVLDPAFPATYLALPTCESNPP